MPINFLFSKLQDEESFRIKITTECNTKIDFKASLSRMESNKVMTFINDFNNNIDCDLNLCEGKWENISAIISIHNNKLLFHVNCIYIDLSVLNVELPIDQQLKDELGECLTKLYDFVCEIETKRREEYDKYDEDDEEDEEDEDDNLYEEDEENPESEIEQNN
jgi:hypothetical protein